jgi:hypothetical protein
VEDISSDDTRSRTEPSCGETHHTSREERTRTASYPGRRDIIRHGAKLAFVAPVVSTFYASQAYAATYSCYPAGHACPGAEPCCGDMVCSDGVCTDTICVASGDLCFGDADCCSNDCQLGVCQ